MKGLKSAIVAMLMFVSLFAVASADPNSVPICHATGSGYVMNAPNAAGVYNGHLGGSHQDGRDIIPPFEYKGETYSQNWDAEGQAIFNNGCEVPATDQPPVTPEEPETPVEPENPTTPEEPETPSVPEVPVAPENPVVPEAPIVPEVPVAPEAPVVTQPEVVAETETVVETAPVVAQNLPSTGSGPLEDRNMMSMWFAFGSAVSILGGLGLKLRKN